MTGTIRVLGAPEPEERYLLRRDETLEILAENAEAPEGFMAVLNPRVTGQYVKKGNILSQVKRLNKGQKPYEFPNRYIVYMK